MKDIEKFISLYSEVLQAITDNHFVAPILFKSFKRGDENTINLVVEDNVGTKSDASVIVRLQQLCEKLRELIPNETITVCSLDEMDPNYYQRLSASNSVHLTPQVPKEALNTVFGSKQSSTHHAAVRCTKNQSIARGTVVPPRRP